LCEAFQSAARTNVINVGYRSYRIVARSVDFQGFFGDALRESLSWGNARPMAHPKVFQKSIDDARMTVSGPPEP